MSKAKRPNVRHIQHARARVKSNTAKDGQGAPSKPMAAGMTDRQLMAALRRANPEKYADPAAPAVKSGARKPETKSSGDTAAKKQSEREDRALEEVLAVVGCTLLEQDASRHASAVKRLFREAVGVKNMALAEHLVTQIATSMTFGQFSTEYERLLGAIALMQEIKPANASEALLACQMNAVHHALMRFLNRATHSEQTFEGADANVLRATRLGRLYIEQLEAMAKLKGKIGQQKVTVEHVHVHEGGQAIVGAVVTSRTGEGGGADEAKGGKTPCIATRPAQERE